MEYLNPFSTVWIWINFSHQEDSKNSTMPGRLYPEKKENLIAGVSHRSLITRVAISNGLRAPVLTTPVFCHALLDIIPYGLMMGGPLKHGCEDYWTWNRQDRSREVQIYGRGSSLSCLAYFHPNWSSGTAAVRGTRVLNNGRYYWELELSRRIFGTSMMFGVATKQARLHADAFVNLIGEDENGWGLSHKGFVFHAGKWAYYTKPFQENVATTVGVLFDGIAGTLTFYKDGVCLGVAFKDLHKVRENLYPIVSSTAAKTQMTLSLMKRDFVNLQDRCRAVIVSQLNKPSDLDSVVMEPGQPLPLTIKKYLAEAMFRTAEPTKKYYVLDF